MEPRHFSLLCKRLALYVTRGLLTVFTKNSVDFQFHHYNALYHVLYDGYVIIGTTSIHTKYPYYILQDLDENVENIEIPSQSVGMELSIIELTDVKYSA